MGLKRIICALVLGGCSYAFSDSNWTATTPNSDLNAPGNWSSGVPTNAIANFDNTAPAGVDTSPDAAADFSVSELNFINSASAFDFTFLNCALLFNGTNVGIFGANTNTAVNIYNQGNSFVSKQLLLNGTTSNSFGRAVVSVQNLGVNAGVDYQVYSTTPVSMGATGSLSLENFASNSGGTGSTGGIVNNSQLFVSSTLAVLDNVTINISNSGIADGLGSANWLGVVGSTGTIECQFNVDTFTADDNLALTLSNSGDYSGLGNDNRIGYLANLIGGATGGQLFANNFTVGDNASMTFSNNGKCKSDGNGNFVAVMDLGQVAIANCTIGKNASINIINSGEYEGDGDQNVVHKCFANAFSTFTAGNNTTLTSTQNNKTTSNGDSNTVGNEGFGIFADVLVVQDNLKIDISSTNSFIGDGNLNGTGEIAVQYLAGTSFSAGDFATFTVTNTGTSQGNGDSNDTAYAILDQVSGFSFTFGDNATISVTNSGSYTGSGSSNSVGRVGVVIADGLSQWNTNGPFQVGDNATITLSNSGSYSGSDTTNIIGVVNGNQFYTSGFFTAGKNLNLSATNTTDNIANDQVGAISGSQFHFKDTFTIGDGVTVTAYNSGTVGQGLTGSAQISFAKGFTLTGKGTFTATNDPAVTSPPVGILVGDSPTSGGGDVNIVLQNSSLVVNSTLPTFTIGALNGDASSYVTCIPQLIIDTDALVAADFAGDIQTAASLKKTGLGTQKLSGTNTFTTTTTVDQGILNLTGSVPGDINVDPSGTLEGNGTAFGTVTNAGKVIPGVAGIGILTAGNYNQTASGTLYVNALNATPTNWGKLVVNNATNIAGNLVVNLLPGNTFSAGQQILILQSGTNISGSFSGFNVLNLPSGLKAELITSIPTQISVLFSKSAPQPPRNLTAERVRVVCHHQVSYTNRLTWTASPSVDVVSYQIYRNGRKIATVPSSQLFYNDTNQDPRCKATYKVFAVDSSGARSKPAVAKLAPCVISGVEGCP